MNSPLPLSRALSRQEFADLARERLDVSRETFDLETMDRLDVYAETLKTWQPRINLVSNKSLDDLWRRHFLDSVQLTKWISPEMRVIDLGSGVVARALAPVTDLLGHAAGLMKPDGFCLFLKGAQADRELTDASEFWNIQVEQHQSLSDPDGAVLKIGNLTRV